MAKNMKDYIGKRDESAGTFPGVILNMPWPHGGKASLVFEPVASTYIIFVEDKLLLDFVKCSAIPDNAKSQQYLSHLQSFLKVYTYFLGSFYRDMIKHTKSQTHGSEVIDLGSTTLTVCTCQ